MDNEGVKLKALCEGLEVENLDKLLLIGTPEHYRAIGQEIAKAAKLGARRTPTPSTQLVEAALFEKVVSEYGLSLVVGTCKALQGLEEKRQQMIADAARLEQTGGHND